MKVVTFVCVSFACLAVPGTYLTRDQALEKVWGESELEKIQKTDHTFYLSSNSADKSSASFHTQKVRSKSQTIMLHVTEEGEIIDILLCKFKEPVKYKPSKKEINPSRYSLSLFFANKFKVRRNSHTSL